MHTINVCSGMPSNTIKQQEKYTPTIFCFSSSNDSHIPSDSDFNLHISNRMVSHTVCALYSYLRLKCDPYTF